MGFPQLRQRIIPKAITNSLAGFTPAPPPASGVVFRQSLADSGSRVGSRQLHRRWCIVTAIPLAYFLLRWF